VLIQTKVVFAWWASLVPEAEKIMDEKNRLIGLILSSVTLAFVPTTALSQDATSVLKRASAMMGEPKSIRYVADGSGFTFGQAFVPGLPWPKITVHNQTRSINYETGAMRDEVTLSRAEPKGGGGYPLLGQGQQRNDQFVSGDKAWNMAGSNPQPGPRFLFDRVHQLWTTPHGVIKAAMKNSATVSFGNEAGKTIVAVKFAEPGRFVATAFFDESFILQRVESRLPDPVLGEVSAVIKYSSYRDFAGTLFPMRIEQSQGGFPILDLNVKEVQPNAAVDIKIPEPVEKFVERVTTEKVADGVWHVAGGSHNSVAIEMKDHMILVEAPLSEGRSAAVISEVKKLAPTKPIRFMINSHNHFDHSGGVRTAASEGATIVVHSSSKAFFEKTLATKTTISPDALSKSGKKAKIMSVAAEKTEMKDSTRTIEIHRIKDGIHNDAFLMVYLPTEKLLIEADAFTPPPPNTTPPSTPNANHVNLIENIERLKLSVDRILPLHGRVVPLADLYTAASRKQ
jgi:glyoxylase-like metal-dependent hydrolase (beta-lactamase superfamily II)